MPRKKKMPSLMNQNKQITSRLMQISLKIDDFIYKSKSITKNEAEMYVEEVESYKISCKNDERSLQVIEKLTRCMKSIIREYQEAPMEYFISEASNRSISPVYSICDEDKTQFTEKDPINEVILNIDNNVTDIFDYDQDINLSNNTVATNCINNIMTSGAEIHRAISHMSLNDIQETIEILSFPEVVDSQSLLKNFEDKAALKQTTTNDLPLTQHITIANKNYPYEINHISKQPTLGTQNKNTVFLDNPLRVTKPVFKIVKDVGLTSKGESATQSKERMHQTKTNLDKNTNNSFFHTSSANNNTTSNDFMNNENVTNKLKNIDDTTNICHNNPTHKLKPMAVQQSPHDFHQYQHQITQNTNSNIYSGVNCSTYQNIPAVNNITKANTMSKTGFDMKHGVDDATSCNQTLNNITTQYISQEQTTGIFVSIQNDINSKNEIDKPITNFHNTQNPKPLKSYNKNKPVANFKDVTTTKKRGPKKKKIAEDRNIKAKPTIRTDTNHLTNALKKSTVTKCKKKLEIVPIYNDNVENDLSWLENIRYVREVNADENIFGCLDIEGSFWDNYLLPPNWDDNEFL